MKRSRMDIQSNDTYVMLDSNTYFKNYLNQKNWNFSENFTKNVLNEYTNELYMKINNYLRRVDFSYNTKINIKPEINWEKISNAEYRVKYSLKQKVENSNEIDAYFNLYKMIKSLSYSLTGLGPYISELDDIPKYTTVYRGVKKKPPAWYAGYKFYFPEFISTSLDEDVARAFGDYIFVITLKGKGYKGVSKLSYYPGEKEVLINAYSKFVITKVDGNYSYMDCYDD